MYLHVNLYKKPSLGPSTKSFLIFHQCLVLKVSLKFLIFRYALNIKFCLKFSNCLAILDPVLELLIEKMRVMP